jgi:hypothetical protein
MSSGADQTIEKITNTKLAQLFYRFFSPGFEL